MRMLAIPLALALLVPFAASPAEAKILTHKKAGVKIDLPDKWAAADEGDDGTLVVEAPNGELAVTFSVVEANDLEQVLEETIGELEATVGEIDCGDAEDIKINGMEGFGIDGTAKGGAMHVSLLCLITPKGKCLTIFYFATAAANDKYDKEIKRIVRGIKKL